MLRGIFSQIEFPYAHFSTDGATAAIIQDAIHQLESIGFKVTGDGASPNRKLFRMHGEKGELT